MIRVDELEADVHNGGETADVHHGWEMRHIRLHHMCSFNGTTAAELCDAAIAHPVVEQLIAKELA